MSRKAELQAELKALDEKIADWEPDPDDHTERYDDMLRECTPPHDGNVRIGGLSYDVAYALKELDPIAYRCGLNDYISNEHSEGLIEPDELIEERDELQEELDTLTEG